MRILHGFYWYLIREEQQLDSRMDIIGSTSFTNQSFDKGPGKTNYFCGTTHSTSLRPIVYSNPVCPANHHKFPSKFPGNKTKAAISIVIKNLAEQQLKRFMSAICSFPYSMNMHHKPTTNKSRLQLKILNLKPSP